MKVKSKRISEREARRIAIQAAVVHQKLPFGRGQAAVKAIVQHLGYIQIDSISVVERAHHHAIRSRLPNFRESQLRGLQGSGDILEYWHHAVAFLPMEQFRFTLPLKQYFRDQRDRWPKADPKLLDEVYHIVDGEGPKMVRDFEDKRDGASSGWWDWKPAKWALERLFFAGKLTCIGRRGFQKIYDTTDRAIPHWVDRSPPSVDEYAEYVIYSALQRFGLTTEKEVTYLLKVNRQEVKKKWREMVADGRLEPVLVGKQKLPYFWTNEPAQIRISREVKILSPFDPLVIQRERLTNLFQFDYQLECYLPKEKRKRGYLALPLLYGDQFIGSLDAKADRKRKKLLVQNLMIEIPLDQLAHAKLERALGDFAMANNCTGLEVFRSNVPIADVIDY